MERAEGFDECGLYLQGKMKRILFLETDSLRPNDLLNF